MCFYVDAIGLGLLGFNSLFGSLAIFSKTNGIHLKPITITLTPHDPHQLFSENEWFLFTALCHMCSLASNSRIFCFAFFVVRSQHIDSIENYFIGNYFNLVGLHQCRGHGRGKVNRIENYYTDFSKKKTTKKTERTLVHNPNIFIYSNAAVPVCSSVLVHWCGCCHQSTMTTTIQQFNSDSLNSNYIFCFRFMLYCCYLLSFYACMIPPKRWLFEWRRRLSHIQRQYHWWW